MEEPGLLPANEHTTAFTIQAVGTWNVPLIGTVHRFTIGVVANEPAQGGNTLGCRLHIHHSFNDTTHIISVTNDAMELEGMLPCVMPDRSGIRVPCILGQVLQTHSSPTQEGQAGTSTAVSGDLACRILLIDASSCAERRNQGFIDETRPHPQVLVTEEVVNLLTLFGVEEFPLILWAFLLPVIDGGCRIVGKPDPEWSSAFPGRNVQVKQFDCFALGFIGE